MIRIKIYYNQNRDVWGISLYNHGDSIVCAGVSALAINAVNSLEKFTDEKIICDYKEEGGLLKFRLPEIRKGGHSHDAALILNSLVLGLQSIAQENRNSIRIQIL